MSVFIQEQTTQPIGRVLSLLGRGYLNLLRTKLQHLDIDRNYYALVLIDSRNGVITQQELATLLDTDKVSIVRVVDYLSEKGYVQRIKQKNDRRKHSLVLTEKAKLALPEIKISIKEINSMFLNEIQNSDVANFAKTIEKIKTNIQENIKPI
jgi:MarR family transcriptional regulator, transcriptional regulator for hemolysin